MKIMEPTGKTKGNKLVTGHVSNTIIGDFMTDYKIVRGRDFGVFAGTLIKKTDSEVTLRDARRLWFWAGAASLSELAQKGTSKPNECKFPCTVDVITLNGWIEIIDVTDAAKASIGNVKEWTA
jgi:hypothetical protein